MNRIRLVPAALAGLLVIGLLASCSGDAQPPGGGGDSKVVAAAAGPFHSLDDGGGLWAWGGNARYGLGP